MTDNSDMYWLHSIYESEAESFFAFHEIDKFVLQIVATDDDGFEIEHDDKGQITIKINRHGMYLKKLNWFVQSVREDLSYNANIQLFRDSYFALASEEFFFDEDPYHYYDKYGLMAAEIFNSFISRIRLFADMEKYRRRARERIRNSSAGYISCVNYLNAMFLKYSRLLAIRLDFSYGQMFVISYEKACEDITHFLNNRRSNSLFSSCVGYIIKLEYTPRKGHHFHTIFLLDGSQSYRDNFLAEQYGKYWILITEGRGIFYNCNSQKYLSPGVGMIHYSDRQKRDNLLKPLKYFMKLDQSLFVKTSPKCRTLWRGEMPVQKNNLVGRPRLPQVYGGA